MSSSNHKTDYPPSRKRTLLSLQHPHGLFKYKQCCSVRGKSTQNTRHKPSIITFPSIPLPYCSKSAPPTFVSPLLPVQRVCHNPLFHHVEGERCEPEGLGRETACPEVYAGDGECGVCEEQTGVEFVSGPPYEEHGAEYDCGKETLVDPADAIGEVLSVKPRLPTWYTIFL